MTQWTFFSRIAKENETTMRLVTHCMLCNKKFKNPGKIYDDEFLICKECYDKA